MPPRQTNEMLRQRLGRPESGWRERWYTIIFEADTRSGRLFDITLLVAIVASVLIVMLDSLSSVHERLGALFTVLEWMFTLLFTAEYVMRILVVRRPGAMSSAFTASSISSRSCRPGSRSSCPSWRS